MAPLATLLSEVGEDRAAEALVELYAQAGRTLDAEDLRAIYSLAPTVVERLAAEGDQNASQVALEGRFLADGDATILDELISGSGRLAPSVIARGLQHISERSSLEVLRALLRRIELSELDYRQASQLARRVAALPDDLRAETGFPRRKIAVLGDVTTDYLAPVLEVALLTHGIDGIVRGGGFGQLEELVLDPTSWLGEFDPDVVVVLSSSLALPGRPAEVWSDVLDRRLALARAINSRLRADAVLTTLELLPEHTGPAGAPDWLTAFNAVLRRELPERTFVFDLAALAAESGIDDWFDMRLWNLARQSVDLNLVPKLAARMGAFLSALDEPRIKLIVTDLDNTLWGGTVAEVGAQAVALDGNTNGLAHTRLQHFLRDRVELGFLLAVCSKNTAGAARSPFEQRPEMVLRLDDFVAFEASFLPKVSVVPELAKSLNIGLQNVLFLDDEPHERAEMRERWPEMLVPEWPSDGIVGLPTVLARSGWIDRPRVTTEDEQRLRMYQQDASRRDSQDTLGDIDDFLRSLELRASFVPVGAENIERVSQLVQKTNQFNLTTYRRTRRELEELSASGGYARAAYVKDRHGLFGLTGVLIAVPRGASLVVDIWLMSCRVMGKTVEFAMFKHLLDYARSARYERIEAIFRPTERNQVIAGLLQEIGFVLTEEADDGRRYAYDVGAEPKRSSHVLILERFEAEGESA